MTTILENMEDSITKLSFDTETEGETKEKQEMSNKRLKIGVIFTLCFLLLNFVLVVIVMSRTSELSSSSSTSNFSVVVNQTHKIDKELEALEKDNRQLKKSHDELKEQFELLSQKLNQLENNISSGRNVSLVTPPPEMTTAPTKNEDQEKIDPHSIKSCSDAMAILPPPRSKKQTIYPHGNGSSSSLEVLCDFEIDGGGWTIIQKRSKGPKEEFSRTWNEYAKGFGSLSGNFWIGLDNIHALTQNGDQELRIELEDFEGEKKYAKYSNFSVSDSSDFYRLSLSGFSASSTAGDSMINSSPSYGSGNFLSGMSFSTKDKDNDNRPTINCAVFHGGGGGWWYKYGCTYSNLNGGYFEKGETSNHKGILWNSWRGYSYSLAKSEMKIRNRK